MTGVTARVGEKTSRVKEITGGVLKRRNVGGLVEGAVGQMIWNIEWSCGVWRDSRQSEGKAGVGLDCHMIDYFITGEQGIAIVDKTRP